MDDCEGYEFRITGKPAGFDESRVMCLEMGGDLIMHNLGPEGSQYHQYAIKIISRVIKIILLLTTVSKFLF